jgi:predicted nucleic acid-binding protein
MITRLFLDTNIVIDYIAHRAHFLSAATLMDMGYRGEVELYITNLTIANTLYIMRKEIGMEAAKDCLKKLCDFVKIAPSTQHETRLAFDTPNPDFEDALQYFSAVSVNANVIITRNEKHFRFSVIPVMDALTYLNGPNLNYSWGENDNTTLNEPTVAYRSEVGRDDI